MTRLAWSPVDGTRFATKAWGVVPRSRSRTQWSGLAGGAFTPASLPNLFAWWDFSGLGLSNGAAISSVSDLSGGGNTLTQATGTKQPLFQTGIQNARAAAQFDGVDDILFTGNVSLTQQFTVLVVGKTTGGTLPQGFVNTDRNGTLRHCQFRLNTALLEMIAFDTVPNAYTDSETATVTTFNQYSGVRGAATVQTWVNGTSGGSTATANTPQSGSTIPIGVGAAGGDVAQTNGPLTGFIGEVIWCAGALGSTDRANAEAWLKQKWNTP